VIEAMETDAELRKFLETIRKALPDAAEKTDEIMRGRGFDSDENAVHLWVETLADVTNMYIRRRDQDEVRKELSFLSKQFERGTDAIRSCIEVSYVENLMWNLAPEDKKWAWPQIPENLKELYAAMWGEPRL
jgi:hypothetical protein